MKKLYLSALLFCSPLPLLAVITITPWQPVFQGIDHATGTNTPDADIPTLQVVQCMRVDLQSPDIQLFTTPPHTNFALGSIETTTMTVSNFLQTYHLAIASDCNFYSASPGGSDPSSEGLPCRVYGLQVCTGAVVSVPDTGPDSNGRYASLLFNTNKQPTLVWDNRPPGVDTTGIFTAISGYYPVMKDGVNVGPDAATNYPDPTIHGAQPRTLIGISKDRRYLFIVTIDGRQDFSGGSTDAESGQWMQLFGAWDAINMDGGGSTAMYMADSCGFPVAVNHSSYLAQTGEVRERIIGSHLGIRAKPLVNDIQDLTIEPGTTTAILRWTSGSPSDSQVEYGPTSSYGTSTPLDATPRQLHVATLSGLNPGGVYHFRVHSGTSSEFCTFKALNPPTTVTRVFDITAAWKYTTNNLDQVSWKAAAFNDSAWSGPGAGLLYIENNAAVMPRTTLLPATSSGGVMRTYYFRRHFDFSGSKSDLTLKFATQLDDGAVFYLNGTEVRRLRLPSAPTAIVNSTAATAQPCQGSLAPNEAVCLDSFDVTGALLNNLVVGDNVLAVEVHNFGAGTDIVFGLSLALSYSTTPPIALQMIIENDQSTFFWNAAGYTLQSSSTLDTPAGWSDLPGPVTLGPVTYPQSPTTFYRLRR